jgi:hypothetical protein
MSTSTTKSGRAAAASLWDVQLAGGEAKMTVDELDHAFQKSSIDEHTLVRKAGAAQWTTLGEAAGLDASTGKLPPASSKAVVDERNAVTTLTAPGEGTWSERLRPRNRKRMLIGFVAAAALVVGGVFAVERFTSSHAPAVAAAPASVSPPSAPPPSAPPPIAPPPAAPPPALAAAAPATPAPAASPASPSPGAVAPASAPSARAIAAGPHRAGHAGHASKGKSAKPRRAEAKKAKAPPHKAAKPAASFSAYGRLAGT